MDLFISGFLILFVVIALFLIVMLSHATYIVRQSEVIIIERLGKYHALLTSGLHFIMPFVDAPRKTLWSFVKETPGSGKLYRYTELVDRIDLREAVYDFPRQSVITKDNVTTEINALLYYQITDPQRAIYEVNNLPHAIEKLTQTTLRNIIGSMDLDETLVSRDQINERLRLILDEATDKWGVKVNRVELQEVNPPLDIRNAMEKQMKAERDRRALILEAEGKKGALILEAEGQKRAAILGAEGYKEAKIASAEGDAQARLRLSQADADSIEIIQKSFPGKDPLPFIIAMNYIKALPEMLKGKNDKVILMPYESSQLLGSLGTIRELFKEGVK